MWTTTTSTCLEEVHWQKDIALGIRVHGLAVRGGYEADKFLANPLICMYACHGKLEEAGGLLQGALPDTFMWYSIISAHVESAKPPGHQPLSSTCACPQ